MFSILSLLGPLSGEPDRVSQMMVLIKTVSKTNRPLFCLSVIYIQKSLQRWKKFFFADTEKDFGSKLYWFPCKNYSFWGLLFSVFWFVKRHSFKPHAFHFQLNYECDVIFAVPQICAYFVDNSYTLEIDSFKIAVSEHYNLYNYCLHLIGEHHNCSPEGCCFPPRSLARGKTTSQGWTIMMFTASAGNYCFIIPKLYLQ